MPIADLSLSSAQQAALELLMSRQSPWPLTAPAPSEEELRVVLEAAMRAPDHGQLQPFRFVLVREAARPALGEVFAQAARARDPEDDGERARSKSMSAPLLIALGVAVRPGHKIPEIEQMLTVGAATMNMLNALHVLGYGGFWASGLNAYDERVKTALGFGPQDRLLGFLYVGTPKEAVRPATRADSRDFMREWTGPAAA